MTNRLVFANPNPATPASGEGKEGKDEEEEKKKKEEEERKKKEEEEKMKKEEEDKKKKEGGEKPEEESVERTKATIAEMARSASETAEKLQKSMKASEAEKQKANAEKMGEVRTELLAINAEDQNISKPVKKYLDELVTRKKITRAKAKQLLELDPLEENYKEKWDKATKGLPDLPKDSVEMKKLVQLKKKEGEKRKELEERFRQAMKKMRELANEMADAVISKADKEKALEHLQVSSGVGIKPGQVLTYERPEEKKKFYATIKEVKFEEIEIKDDDGKLIKKVTTDNPVVVVESLHPVTSEIKQDTFTSQDFHEWGDEYNVMEDIDSIPKLNQSIGTEVKDGAKFEFEMVHNPGTKEERIESIFTEIKRIDENNHLLILDQNILTAQGSKQIVTYGEFAKWYKKNKVLPEIKTFENLRHELMAFNEAQNTIYERPSGQYPPIKVEEGETLYYDDNTDRTFVIKAVNEKEKTIEFDSGDKKSFTGFLRWVKKYEVEKKTADSEAEKRTEGITDPDKKEAEKERIKKEAEKDIEERKKAGEEPLKGYAYAVPEEPARHSISYLRKLWRKTEFLSIQDLGVMGKTIWEFIKRKWHRWQQGRVGAVGQAIFGKMIGALGAEFKSIAQQSENEEVQHHIKHLETMGIDTVKHELHHPPDKDTFKAAVTVLCKKGQMRWDDPHFWHAVQHFSGVPIDPAKHLEQIEKIFDGWWGDDTFREFRNSQDSSYNSIKKNFEDTAMRLENDPNGLRGELNRLLYNFIHGMHVNPAQYEELLDYSMKAGKMVFEDKMFFMIMGVGATNAKGETLLHADRISAIEGIYLNILPIMDFFVSPWLQAYDKDGRPLKEIDKETGKEKPKTVRPNINTFKYWIKTYIQPDLPGGDITTFKPTGDKLWGTNFTNFVRETIAWDKYAAFRAEKAAKDPSSWDHDDMDMFVQLLDEGTIDQITRLAGGARQQVSNTGLKNAMAGLNEFIKRKIISLNKALKEGDKEKADEDYKHLLKMLRSSIRVDAILMDRYDHGNANKVRFSDDTLNSDPLCDDTRPVKAHMAEMRKLIGDLSEKLGLKKEFDIVVTQYRKDQEGERKQQHSVVHEFGRQLAVKMEEHRKTKGFEDLSNLLVDYNHLGGIGHKSATKDLSKILLEESKASSSTTATASTPGPSTSSGDTEIFSDGT